MDVVDGQPFGFASTQMMFLRQFLSVYSPLLLNLMSILLIILRLQKTPEEVKSLEKIQQQQKLKESPKYTHFTDDRKAKKGDEGDVYMLKTHGYDKLRFLSKSFIKRNKLKTNKAIS